MSAQTPPSDQDDFDPFIDHPVDAEVTTTTNPLMKFLVGVVVFALLCILLATITANNSAPNSAAETIALSINRLSRMTLLVAFLGVLIVLRLPQIKALMMSDSEDQDDAYDGSIGSADQAENDRSLGLVSQTNRLRNSPSSGGRVFLPILLISLVICFAAWLLVYSLPSSWMQTAATLANGGIIILAALTFTIAIVHRGPLQAFAIGVTFALFFNRLSAAGGLDVMLASYQNYGYSGSADDLSRSVYRYQAANITIALLSGLIACGYVTLLEVTRHRMGRKSIMKQPTP